MSEWRENHNGNYVQVDDGTLTTVFKTSDNKWRGIRDEMMTEEIFDSAEKAMDAVDECKVKFNHKIQSARNTGWRVVKKGGYYRRDSGRIVTVKQAQSGKWFITFNGKKVEDQWLHTKEEAMKLADLLLW
jgi:hypothetical protein